MMDINLRMDPVFNIGWYPEEPDFEEYEDEDVIRKASRSFVYIKPGGKGVQAQRNK